jgi:hypothetical protein
MVQPPALTLRPARVRAWVAPRLILAVPGSLGAVRLGSWSRLPLWRFSSIVLGPERDDPAVLDHRDSVCSYTCG